MTKTGLEFRILVIVICDLEFLVPPADCRKMGKTIESSSGGAESRVLRAQILYPLLLYESLQKRQGEGNHATLTFCGLTNLVLSFAI